MMIDISKNEVETVIQRCLSSNNQVQAAIIGLFLEQKSLLEAAEELGLTPQQVLVLNSDALGRLRSCEEFLLFVEKIT